MEMSSPESLLHPKIAKFYKLSQYIIDRGNICNYFNEDGTYNWSSLQGLLLSDAECLMDDPVYPNTYDEYLQFFHLIQPVLDHSKVALTKLTSNGGDVSIWFSKLQWLGPQTQMRTILQEHLQPSSDTSTVENILFLTSILENGLANVYHTITRKSPPHLLRDLLDTKELRDFLGICPILFLKIIMGSPDSVNLRNIAWHGFPLPSEVPHCYTAALFITSASLSTLIDGKKMKLVSRPQMTDFSRFIQKIKSASIDFTLLDDIPRMEGAIKSSKWTGHSDHKLFWLQILQHYQSGDYWQFVILILPQIELVLRRMYGEANEFDITAKLDEYYITMNSIFESIDNRLLTDQVCKGTLHLLYDIFISPYGMRIRDKVSHGEVDLNCIDRDLCLVLLYAGLNLITSEDYPLDDYESRFHLNCLAYECIHASKKGVLGLLTLKTPRSFGLDFEWDSDSIATLQELEIERPSQLFNCPKKEPEIVTILMKIAQLTVQVCENYQISFEERFRMLLNHELRSRARKTLERMVESMTVIVLTLTSIVQCSVGLLSRMQTEKRGWFEDKFANIQRFGKQTLTIMENFVRFSDRESNEWLNALACCSRFKEIRKNLYPNMDEKNIKPEQVS